MRIARLWWGTEAGRSAVAHRYGSYRWAQVSAGTFLEDAGVSVGIGSSFRLIDEHVAVRAMLER